MVLVVALATIAGIRLARDDSTVGPGDLGPFVLRASDLPTGWRAVEPDDPALPTTLGACFGAGALTPADPEAARRVTFGLATSGPFLDNLVIDHLEPDVATRAFDAVRQVPPGCLGDGATSPAPGDHPGADEVSGLRATVEGDGETHEVELRAARVGRYVAYVLVLGARESDLEVGDGALDVVVGRLR